LGSGILDTGYWILDAGYWILDAGLLFDDDGSEQFHMIFRKTTPCNSLFPL
jgi:hypothetical protein